MRDRDIGDVLVTREGVLMGIVTDRDIVVRVLAQGVDPRTTGIEEACGGDLVVVSADDAVNDVIRLLRASAIRRVPVMEDRQAIGIISLGDLARQLDPQSVLAENRAPLRPASDGARSPVGVGVHAGSAAPTSRVRRGRHDATPDDAEAALRLATVSTRR